MVEIDCGVVCGRKPRSSSRPDNDTQSLQTLSQTYKILKHIMSHKHMCLKLSVRSEGLNMGEQVHRSLKRSRSLNDLFLPCGLHFVMTYVLTQLRDLNSEAIISPGFLRNSNKFVCLCLLAPSPNAEHVVTACSCFNAWIELTRYSTSHLLPASTKMHFNSTLLLILKSGMHEVDFLLHCTFYIAICLVR